MRFIVVAVILIISTAAQAGNIAIGFKPERLGNIYVREASLSEEAHPTTVTITISSDLVGSGNDAVEVKGIDLWGKEFFEEKRRLKTEEGRDVVLRYPIEVKRKGVYHVRVWLRDEKGKVATEASSSFGIIPDVALKKTRPESPFGIGSYFAVRFDADALKKAARLQNLLGCAWNRDELQWDLCEPRKGEWRCERFDRTVNACRENNILILGLLDYWVKWSKPLTDEGYEAYGNYVKKVVARYKPDGEFAKEQGWKDGYGIGHWEIWNEPATFWSGTPEQFGQLLRVAYIGVKQADPEGIVFFSNAGASFDERVLKTAGMGAFDAITPHYYCPPRSPEAAKLDNQVRSTVEFFHTRGIERPFWCSEMGWHSTDEAVSQREQANFLVRSFVIALAEGIDKLFWYNFINDSLNKTEHHFGLINREDFTPKFGYGAYAALIGFLESTSYHGDIHLLRDIRCYVFEEKGKASSSAVAVLWSSGAEGEMEFECEKQMEVFDIFGNKIAANEGKRFNIPLRSDPVYLVAEGISAQKLESILDAAKVKGIASVELKVLPIKGPLAEKPPLRVEVSNLGKTSIGGKVSLEVPYPWKMKQKEVEFAEMKPGESSILNFAVARLRRYETNKYDVMARLETSSGEKAEQKRTLSELVAVKASPEIDGELGDWKGARWVYLDDSSQAVGLAPWADFNISARVATAWDEGNFYFAAEVTDNYFHQPHTGATVWEGDNFQIDFDCLNTKKKPEENPGFVELGLSLTKRGPEVFKWGVRGGEQSGLVKEARLVVNCRAENKYVYEAQIPGSALPLLKLKARTQFGFSFILNDNDGGGRRGWLEWTPGIGTGKDPSCYTEWTLVKK